MLGLNNPLALLGLAAVPLVYFLYIRTRSDPVRVPSVLIWKKVEGDASGAPEKKRSPDLRMLAYLVAITAGVLSIARPVVSYTAEVPRTMIVLIDRSASMGASLPGGGIRISEAAAEAAKELSAMRAGDRVVLVGTAGGAVSRPMSPSDARRAIDGIGAVRKSGRIDEDMRLAASVQKTSPGSVLRVYTDSLPKNTGLLDALGPHRIVSFGEPTPNGAIVNAHLSPAGEIHVWVRNFSGEGREMGLTADVGGGKTLEVRKAVGPDETLRVRLGSAPESSKTMRVTLYPDDALPADNAVTISRTEGAGMIKIYGRRDPRLEKALKAIPGVEVRNVWGDPPDRGPAVILGAGCPFLPSGDVAVVNPLGRAGPITVEGRRAAGPPVVDAPDDPLMESVPVRDLDAEEVLFGRFPRELRSLVSADGLPVVATMPNTGGRILYVGFDISSGGWHTRASFPIFWCNFFGRGQKGYQVDGLLDSSESDLRSKAGVIEGGAERASPGNQTRERDLSPFLLLVTISATALLCFSRRR